MRVLAVDYGKARVGIAITDPLGVISQPLVTLKYKSDKAIVIRLKYLVQKNEVGLILVGHPVSMRGEATTMSLQVEKFVLKLRRALDIEVKLWDERLTSKYAHSILKEMGLGRDIKRVDQIAACIMLDEYLKSQTHCSA